MFPDTRIEDKVFADLKNYCGNSNGYITYEEPATHDTTEFLERVKVRTPNTGLRRGGLTCKLGALCFYSSSVLADSFVLRSPLECKVRNR
jgi:hypothetical protein